MVCRLNSKSHLGYKVIIRRFLGVVKYFRNSLVKCGCYSERAVGKVGVHCVRTTALLLRSESIRNIALNEQSFNTGYRICQ